VKFVSTASLAITVLASTQTILMQKKFLKLHVQQFCSRDNCNFNFCKWQKEKLFNAVEHFICSELKQNNTNEDHDSCSSQNLHGVSLLSLSANMYAAMSGFVQGLLEN